MARCVLVLGMVLGSIAGSSGRAEPLPGTQPLTTEGDLAAQMVAGIDKHLMRELVAAAGKRKEFWKPDFSSPEAYVKSVQPNRERLKKILGVVDPRLSIKDLEYISHGTPTPLVAEAESYKVFAVRWPVLEGVNGEGLLLEPKGKAIANVVALPDADWTPEMIVGLAAGVPTEGQFARILAENGCRVLVPTLIDRKDTWSGNPRFRLTNQSHREFIYRQAYQMGRHIIGYEIQKVLAAVDFFTREPSHPPSCVFGYGEGGMLALYTGAIDERIAVTAVSGYFTPREELWQEPIYRNVWGLLREFSDAEILAMFVPRSVVVEHTQYVEWKQPAPAGGRSGGAPGQLTKPGLFKVVGEIKRSMALVEPIKDRPAGRNHFGFEEVLNRQPVVGSQALKPFLAQIRQVPDNAIELQPGEPPADRRKGFVPSIRQHRQFDQLVGFTQKLMRDAKQRRQEFFWNKLNLSSGEAFEKSTQPFRDYLWEQVIGKLPAPTVPMNPRTRQSYDEPKWKGYEVTLNLYPDVYAYGILLVPKDLKPGERRPVVVCQHGLEGRPQECVNPRAKTLYHSFAAQLADRGYIVYAPQNPYIGEDRFRVLQRKANPLKLSLFSFIVRQHERTLDWLAGLPFVDPKRLAFYGLSYGGKTAMRVPALLPRYALSICSGDFNEWTWVNVSVDFPNSYLFCGEYEIPEFDMGQTLVYAEMAALIAPRPFMVERGHDDGNSIDEWVDYEYAKVRRLYSRLKLPDRTAIEFFDGGHVINGKGTFEFLDRQLRHKPGQRNMSNPGTLK